MALLVAATIRVQTMATVTFESPNLAEAKDWLENAVHLKALEELEDYQAARETITVVHLSELAPVREEN